MKSNPVKALEEIERVENASWSYFQKMMNFLSRGMLREAEDVFQNLAQEYKLLNEDFNFSTNKLKETEENFQNLTQQHTLLKEDFDCNTKKLKESEVAFQGLEQEHRLLNEKFYLVSKNLSSKIDSNVHFENFQNLVTKDYMDFAAEESSLAGEAQSAIELHKIIEDLGMVVSFPNIASKTILAVAGGFSSGKSSFINNFLENSDIELSVGMNPVTSIPSYIACHEETKIMMRAKNGGQSELDQDIYKRMSKEYVEGFGFDLRKIMPLIFVKAPLSEKFFANICVVDTPGYNPGSQDEIRSGDKEASIALLGKASAMIWMLNIDAGTIPTSDLEIIKNSGISDDNLYIVLNKADLKPPEDIEDIMQDIVDILDDEDIGYSGICAYSSIMPNDDYGHIGQSLSEFLASINNPSNVYDRFARRIDHVFQAYYDALKNDEDELKKRKNSLNEMRMFLLEFAGTDSDGEFKKRFSSISSTLDPEIKKLEGLIAKAKKIHEKLISSLGATLSDLGIQCVREEIMIEEEQVSQEESVDLPQKDSEENVDEEKPDEVDREPLVSEEEELRPEDQDDEETSENEEESGVLGIYSSFLKRALSANKRSWGITDNNTDSD